MTTRDLHIFSLLLLFAAAANPPRVNSLTLSGEIQDEQYPGLNRKPDIFRIATLSKSHLQKVGDGTGNTAEEEHAKSLDHKMTSPVSATSRQASDNERSTLIALRQNSRHLDFHRHIDHNLKSNHKVDRHLENISHGSYSSLKSRSDDGGSLCKILSPESVVNVLAARERLPKIDGFVRNPSSISDGGAVDAANVADEEDEGAGKRVVLCKRNNDVDARGRTERERGGEEAGKGRGERRRVEGRKRKIGRGRGREKRAEEKGSDGKRRGEVAEVDWKRKRTTNARKIKPKFLYISLEDKHYERTEMMQREENMAKTSGRLTATTIISALSSEYNQSVHAKYSAATIETDIKHDRQSLSQDDNVFYHNASQQHRSYHHSRDNARSLSSSGTSHRLGDDAASRMRKRRHHNRRNGKTMADRPIRQHRHRRHNVNHKENHEHCDSEQVTPIERHKMMQAMIAYNCWNENLLSLANQLWHREEAEEKAKGSSLASRARTTPAVQNERHRTTSSITVTLSEKTATSSDSSRLSSVTEMPESTVNIGRISPSGLPYRILPSSSLPNNFTYAGAEAAADLKSELHVADQSATTENIPSADIVVSLPTNISLFSSTNNPLFAVSTNTHKLTVGTNLQYTETPGYGRAGAREYSIGSRELMLQARVSSEQGDIENDNNADNLKTVRKNDVKGSTGGTDRNENAGVVEEYSKSDKVKDTRDRNEERDSGINASQVYVPYSNVTNVPSVKEAQVVNASLSSIGGLTVRDHISSRNITVSGDVKHGVKQHEKRSVEDQRRMDIDDHDERHSDVTYSDDDIRRMRCRYMRAYERCRHDVIDKIYTDDYGVPISWPKQVVDVMDSYNGLYTMMFY